jgi:hypothetical protein
MDDQRLAHVDELVRSATSFVLYAANPKHHLARLLQGLSVTQRMRIVKELHCLAKSADPGEADCATFVGRRLFNIGLPQSAKLDKRRRLNVVMKIISGVDVFGLSTLLAISLLYDSETVRVAVENALSTLFTHEVTLPAQGACMLAACDFSNTQLTALESLPKDIEAEYNLLGVQRIGQSESDDDYDDYDDGENVEEYDKYDLLDEDEDEDLKRVHRVTASADPFLREMLQNFEMLPPLGDLSLVIPRNLENLRALASDFAALTRQIVEAQARVLPTDSTTHRLGLIDRPTGIIVPTRELIVVQRSLSTLMRGVEESRDSLLSMSPSDFERFMANTFRALGFHVEHTALTRDGGADLLCLRSEHGIPFRVAIEVKRYRPDRLVDVSLVRSFVGANQKFGAHRQVFVTTSGYTRPAWEFGSTYAQHLLMLRDYEAIRDWCREARLRQGW